MRIVIAGGGTGGHLFPGLAVANAVVARVPGATISFAGTAAGIESRVIPKTAFGLDLIRSAGLVGKSLGSRLRGASLLPLSAVDAWRVISRRRPDVVIGVGGYSSGPIVALAALRGIPTLVLEQNAVPGLTNRWLARLVRRAAVTYETSLQYFGDRGFVAGNPVRREFFEIAAHERRPGDRIGVLVFGGSQGAHVINVAIAGAAPQLARSAVPFDIVCQTGERDRDMVTAAFADADLPARVEPFIADMASAMASCDIVVSRAGATTLAEVTAAGRASILIPLPAADHHQHHNARVLADAGAAEVIDQDVLTGERLAGRILALAGDHARRAQMAAAARRLARPRAADDIVEAILVLAEQRTR